jgi:hydroxymethylpyrimidine pyrophosphatase-like HAD family hydrolase
MESQGIVALDIDGTLTASHNEIPARVVEALHRYALNGWHVVFITVRPFCHCTML